MGTTLRRALGVLVATIACVSVAACSGADEPDGRNTGGNGDGDGGGGTGFDDGTGGDGDGGDGDGSVVPMPIDEDLTVAGTFIWIANSEEGTVSKIDTRTMEELGRYLTNPSGDGHPSRTSVGGTGAVAVANRGGGQDFATGEAGVVKIEASEARCYDRNNNGIIETSSGASDVLPWMADECLAWWTPLAWFSNRPVSWAPPAGPDLPETVWTAGANDCTADACYFSVARLNGDTGTLEELIDVGPLSGVSFIGGGVLDLFGFGFAAIPNYGPYGGAPDAAGNFWGFIGNTTHLFRVDGVTLDVLTWPIPSANAYGITVDPKGRVFLCGPSGMTRFDPGTQTFTENFDMGLGFNGCMTDGDQLIWAGGDALNAYDAETLALTGSYDVGGRIKGVSVDFDGRIWGVGQQEDTRAFRLDVTTGAVDVFDGLVGPYSYSDMTGFGLEAAGYTPVVVE